MLRTARNTFALLFIVLAHVCFLIQGAMLGCSFEATAANFVDDNMDAPNSYTCSRRCSTSVALNMRVSAALDDVEGPQGSDPDGATDLDLGGAIVGVRFTSLAIPPGAVITAATIQFTADQAFGADNTTPLNLDVFAEAAELPQALGGATTYVLRVIDAFGQSDEDATAVGVVDTTAPALSLSVSPTLLWPPNHKLVPVTVTAAVNDVCDPSPTLRLVSITSNEGALANGSGHTSPDIQDAQFGTDDRQFLLRAERRGFGPGRIYTITYEAEDANGNVTTRQVTVAVP